MLSSTHIVKEFMQILFEDSLEPAEDEFRPGGRENDEAEAIRKQIL